MTTTIRVETSQHPALVRIKTGDTYQPDTKVEPYDSGLFHISGNANLSVTEANDQVEPGTSEPPAAA